LPRALPEETGPCSIIVRVCLDSNGNMECDDNDEEGIVASSVKLSTDTDEFIQSTGPNGYTTFDDEITYPKDEAYTIILLRSDDYVLYGVDNKRSQNGKKIWVRSTADYTLNSEDFFIRDNGQCVAQIQYPLMYAETAQPPMATPEEATTETTEACSIVVRVCLDIENRMECNNDNDVGIELESAIQLSVNDNEFIYGPKNTGINGYASFPGWREDYEIYSFDKNVVTLLGVPVLNRGENSIGTKKVSVLNNNSYELSERDFVMRTNGKCQAWIQWPILSCSIIVLVCVDRNGNMECDGDEEGIMASSVKLSMDNSEVQIVKSTGPDGYSTFSDAVTYARDDSYKITLTGLEGYASYGVDNVKSRDGERIWVRNSADYALNSEDFFITNDGQCVAQIQYPLVYVGKP